MCRYIGRCDPFHELSFIWVFERGLLGETCVTKSGASGLRWTDLDQVPRFAELASMVMRRFGRWLTARSEKFGEVIHDQNVLFRIMALRLMAIHVTDDYTNYSLQLHSTSRANANRVCFNSVRGFFEACRGKDGSNSFGSIGGFIDVIGFNGLLFKILSTFVSCCRTISSGREREARSFASGSTPFLDSCAGDRGSSEVVVLLSANTDRTPLANGLRDLAKALARFFASANSLSTLGRLLVNWCTMSATASEPRLCRRVRSTLRGLFNA